MNIASVPQDLIALVEEQVIPLIQAVVDKAPDEITVDSIMARLYKGDSILVVIYDNSKIIALNTLDVRILDTGKRVLYIPITTGTRMDEWLDDFMLLAKKIAKHFNCESLRGLSVRKGWLRALNKKDDVWKEVHTVIELELKENEND